MADNADEYSDNVKGKIAVAMGAIVCVQLWLANSLPIFADEAYYLSCSSSLSWGYYDHPPMIGWLLWAMPIRFVSLACFYLGLWFVFLAARQIDSGSAVIAPLLIMCSPLGMVGGVVATPDSPVFLLGAAALYGVLADRAWVAAFACGAAILSKMTFWICLPAFLLLLSYRGRFKVVAISLLMVLGHALWSIDNQGLPWAFQSDRPLGLFSLPDFLVGQLGIVGPALCFLAWRLWRHGGPIGRRYFIYLIAPTLGLCLGASCVLRVEANWPLLAWVSVAVFGAGAVSLRFVNWLFGYGAVVAMLAVVATCYQSSWPPGQGPDRLGDDFQNCLNRIESKDTIAALRYQEMALASYAGRAVNYYRPTGRRLSQYDLQKNVSVNPCGQVVLGPFEVRRLVCSSERDIPGCRPYMAVCDCED